MQSTKGVLNKIKHHHVLPIAVNENCAIPIPNGVMQKFYGPHRLSYYYFVFIEEGTASFSINSKDITLAGGQLIFGLPGQVFNHQSDLKELTHYKAAFDEDTLAYLANNYPFLTDPAGAGIISFDEAAAQRVKTVLSILFQLLHRSGEQKKPEIILAHFNTLLTELNSAYFEQYGYADRHSNARLSKYNAFKLMVETHLTEQPDIYSIAETLATSTSQLYGVVKEFSGISPKEWMTSRLMLEARRKLQHSDLSVKELAYELGFNDPDYFSRLFKKSTGKSVRTYVTELRDLSGK